MTDKDNNSKRSRLTLKLPTTLKNSNLSNKTDNNKITLNKKLSNSSSVQVTIKGRKSSQAKNKEINDIDKKDLEAKIKAISSTQSKLSKVEKNIKTHEILGKITRENRDKKNSQIEISNDASDQNQELSSKPDTSNDQDISTSDSKIDLGIIDNFDVRNKIKKSLQIANKEKEEREKIIEERKRKEIEQNIEKEKLEIEKKKIKKNSLHLNKNFNDDESYSKSNTKDSLKNNNRFNTRKRTYIINSDDDSEEYSSSFRRKKLKNQIKNEEQKEYKKIIREVSLPDLITVSELAERMSEKAGDVVKKLFSMGMVVTSNQAIDTETAEIIVNEFGHTSKKVSFSDVENVLDEATDKNIDQLPRSPVVTIMGHVDHGKTSLLDALRETDVVSGEHGGITQHIGASRIQTKDHKFITFLDTPGHEAFTEMRSRGANVTDIVILVVAADDGVKEQTVEAINHAKAANVPIIVAINKIDKPGANPQIVKNELLNYQLVSEDLGGDVIFVPVSAKTKTNLDKLEEAILLQAEILDLKAPHEGKSSGVVLESKVDSNKGVVATLLVQKGTLDNGDIIVVGTTYGKIRKMTDSSNKQLKSATPSMPVEVLGLENAPNAGDKFVEVSIEKQAREIISYRIRKEKEEKALKNSARSISDIFKESGKGKIKYLNVIVKADVHGSVEAINNSLAKINNDEVSIKIIHSATGGITESDISLASASNAIIIGFNTRANLSAKELSLSKSIEIRYYSIIYNLVDDIKLLLSGLLNPIKNEEYLGQAEIRQVFKISNTGKIAGSFVVDGVIKRNARARLLRDNIVIHDGSLKTLKRFKEDAKEVKSGFECGIAFDNFEDIKEKDIIECYEITEQKRSL